MACESLLMTSYPQQVLNQSAIKWQVVACLILTDLLQLVDKLQQAGITENLQQVCGELKLNAAFFAHVHQFPAGNRVQF